MKNFKILASSLLVGLLLFSCSQDNDDVTISETPEQVTTNATNIPTEVAAKLSRLGYNVANVERKEISMNGETVSVWADDDVYILEEDLENIDLAATLGESEDLGKAFIENARINTNQGSTFNGTRFISIGLSVGTDINGNSIDTPAVRRALQRAVNTLNNIGSRIFFVIGPDNGASEVTIVPNLASTSLTEGFAFSPVNGNFSSGFIAASSNNERDLGAVIMHELMHGMGFRHSDFENRESCRLIGDFAQASVVENQNANFVPGTSGNRRNTNSIMTACFIGNFNLFQEDINAIRGIYGR